MTRRMPTPDEEKLRALKAELAHVTRQRDALERSLAASTVEAAAVRAAPIGVMCVCGRTGRYLFINAEFAHLLRRDKAELLASDPFEIWKEVTHPEDIATEGEAVARLARGEIDRFELDKRFVLPDGALRWVHVCALATRDQNERLASMTVFFTDLQSQRELAEAHDQLQAQLRHSQKLEALGRLAGGVAHDFNNRLLIIMGYSEMLRRALPRESQLQQHVEAILHSSQRAADLTRQLLAYTRRQVLRPQTFDVNVAIEQMCPLLERVLGERIELKTELLASHPILFDPGQLEQVLLNLAINARDAMANGGQFQLATKDVCSSAAAGAGLPPGGHVLLSARDSGAGISQDVLPHIFEPFFTTKEVGQGSGLGLSIVEGIVSQSGGSISVETEFEQGTTFHVYLPYASDMNQRMRYGTDDAPQRAVDFETVLVCDDDDSVRKLLLDILQFGAYNLLESRNGRHALEVAQEHPGPIHLLITDVAMPGLGGVELASELRKLHPQLKVVYLSGYPEQAALLSEPQDRCSRFLAKPFLPGDLTTAVFSLLDSSEAASD